MNIIFFTCIFVIEQVYQNKLSTKATGPAVLTGTGPAPPAQRPVPSGLRRAPPAHHRPQAAGSGAARPLGAARLHRQRRDAAVPPSGALHATGPRPTTGKGGVSAERCLGLGNPCHRRGGRPRFRDGLRLGGVRRTGSGRAFP